MKPEELKREFIQLRAEGNSYNIICETLHISKATCTQWSKTLADQINELRRQELAELAEGYGIAKEARIRRLGGILEKIDHALEETDFSSIDPAKLLDHSLRYTEALKEEYESLITLPVVADPEGDNAQFIVMALESLLNRVRAGEVTTEQAHRESTVLAQLLRAYEATELKQRIDSLEAVLERRQ